MGFGDRRPRGVRALAPLFPQGKGQWWQRPPMSRCAVPSVRPCVPRKGAVSDATPVPSSYRQAQVRVPSCQHFCLCHDVGWPASSETVFRSNLQGALPSVLGSRDSRSLRVETGGRAREEGTGSHAHTGRRLAPTCPLSLKTGPLASRVKAPSPGGLAGPGLLSQRLEHRTPAWGALTHRQLHPCQLTESRAGAVRQEGEGAPGRCPSFGPWFAHL